MLIFELLSKGGRMPTTTISIQVDEDLARLYQSAPSDDQSKLRLLMNLWLRELLASSTSLNSLMDEISDKAQARGLTAAKLAKMLHGQ